MQKQRKPHKQQEDRLLTQLTRQERKRQERIRNRMLAENEFIMGRDIRAYA
jgi:hypothetical protein